MRIMLRNDERNSVGLLFGCGFKSVVARNVRIPFYLGLHQLKQRHDIIIKSADKGSAVVLMDRSTDRSDQQK